MTAYDDTASAAAAAEARDAATPWLAHYEPGVPAVLPAGETSPADVVAGAAAVAPTFPAVTDGRRALHFAALSAAADRVAAALARDGIGAGDTVVVALPPGPTALTAILGGLRAGVDVAPADGAEASAAAELAVALEARAAVVVDRAADAFAAAVERAGRPVPRLVRLDPLRELRWPVRLVAQLGGARPAPTAGRPGVAWQRWLGTDASPGARSRDDAAGAIVLDGVRFSAAEVAAGARMLGAWLTDASPGDDTWLILAPLSSGLGAVAALGTAPALRARAALVGGDAVDDVVDALRYVRPAWVVSDVAVVARLAAEPALAGVDLRGVRGWLVGGPVPAPLARAFAEASGVELCIGWAPRGAAGFVACNPVNGQRRADSVGLPLPGATAVGRGAGLVVRAPNCAASLAGAEGAGCDAEGARLDDDGYIVFEPVPGAATELLERFARGRRRVTGARARR